MAAMTDAERQRAKRARDRERLELQRNGYQEISLLINVWDLDELLHETGRLSYSEATDPQAVENALEHLIRDLLEVWRDAHERRLEGCHA